MHSVHLRKLSEIYVNVKRARVGWAFRSPSQQNEASNEQKSAGELPAMAVVPSVCLVKRSVFRLAGLFSALFAASPSMLNS